MNVFILDESMELSAQYLADKHLNKILIEQTQVLCTAFYVNDQEIPTEAYKLTHPHHPWSRWVKSSLSNWLWLQEYTLHMGDEFIYRYGKSHRSAVRALLLPEPLLEDIGLTDFPQVVPEDCRSDDAVSAYRKYYNLYKRHLFKWKNRPIPDFIEM